VPKIALHYKVSGIGRFRLPTAGPNQELAGESACPTFSQEGSRAEDPSQQAGQSPVA